MDITRQEGMMAYGWWVILTDPTVWNVNLNHVCKRAWIVHTSTATNVFSVQLNGMVVQQIKHMEATPTGN